jgi:hypothetical protein
MTGCEVWCTSGTLDRNNRQADALSQRDLFSARAFSSQPTLVSATFCDPLSTAGEERTIKTA